MNFSISYLREIYNSLKSSKEGGLKGIVIKGTAGTFTLKIINKALAFISSLILARTLDVSGYGAYSYILAIVVPKRASFFYPCRSFILNVILI